MNTLVMQTRLGQTTTFAPRLQQAVRLLQLSALDYAQELQEAAEDNPFLELDDFPAAGNGPADDARADEPDWAAVSALDRMTSSPQPGSHLYSPDDGADMLQGLPLPTSLRGHLHAQLGVLRLPPQERALAQWIVESLDDDGYLRISLEEISHAIGGVENELADELAQALCRVQSLDPAGVGARSVAECLALQLPGVADTDLRTVARRIIEDQMQMLASRNLPKLAAALGLEESRVRAAVECIRHMNARPGWQFSDSAARVITPDVIVRKVRGAWTAVLNDAAVPRVHLHKTYAALFEAVGGNSANAEMQGYLEKARWTLQNLAQRISTIHEVAKAIVVRQKLFLEYGPLAMKPLGLREIADVVGVHPSTVSRTVHNKFMATPAGVFELKYFFSRGLDHASGGASAPTAVRELIRELIAAERPSAPLTDAELARQLAQQGFRIARRTVTKYRQALNLDAFDCRRRSS